MEFPLRNFFFMLEYLSLKERNQYTYEQKKFFIDFGLTIIKVIYDLTHNNEKR